LPERVENLARSGKVLSVLPGRNVTKTGWVASVEGVEFVLAWT